ncbi:hypothetical protein [Runella salmonicolor]|uniref:Uncharacterized protein n=1 Tax=Runella salmonicolor TaxID=2950278 RepID=A0ABT1FWA1_9BACT|nr:hypothetical protein [Runella salmonicolor]MCP1385048.1 hypothetical protein [Runella salmonicolor]
MEKVYGVMSNPVSAVLRNRPHGIIQQGGVPLRLSKTEQEKALLPH